MAVVLHRKGNTVLPQILDAMVADRDLVGIPAQVFDHLWCAHKGTLAVHYPFLCKKGSIEIRGQVGPFPEAFREPRPEHLGHGPYREQVLSPVLGVLPLAAGRDSPARDN